MRLNRAGLTLNRAGLTLNRAGLTLNRAGLTLNRAGLTLNRAGLTLNRAGLTLNRAGLTLGRGAMNLRPRGMNLGPENVKLAPEGPSGASQRLSFCRPGPKLIPASFSLLPDEIVDGSRRKKLRCARLSPTRSLPKLRPEGMKPPPEGTSVGRRAITNERAQRESRFRGTIERSRGKGAQFPVTGCALARSSLRIRWRRSLCRALIGLMSS